LAIGSDFSIIIFPQNPDPNSEITAKIETYSFDADRSSITWEIDNKIVVKGEGEKTVKFISPSIGKEKVITAYVTTAENSFNKKSLRIVGHDMNILWEARTSTPGWYKGKALPVLKSSVKAVAIPCLFSGGKEILPTGLIYEWFLNYKKDINASGAGKDFFVFKIEDYDDYVVRVRVSNRDESVSFEKAIFLSNEDFSPKALFYEFDPLNGLDFSNALKNQIDLLNNEIIIKAEPFFFSNENLSRLSFKWTMNNKEIITEEDPSVLDIRANPDEQLDASDIGLSISNPLNIFQAAQGKIRINY
jgi:hypothetical protein